MIEATQLSLLPDEADGMRFLKNCARERARMGKDARLCGKDGAALMRYLVGQEPFLVDSIYVIERVQDGFLAGLDVMYDK